MTRYYRRRRLDRKRTATAAAVAAGVAAGAGAVAFYVARIVLAREPMDRTPGREDRERAGEGASREP